MKRSVFYVCSVWASFGLGVTLRLAARRPANQTQTLIHSQRLLLPFSLFHLDLTRGWWFSFCNWMRCDSYVFTLIVFNSWVHYEISKCVAQTAISRINRFVSYFRFSRSLKLSAKSVLVAKSKAFSRLEVRQMLIRCWGEAAAILGS